MAPGHALEKVAFTRVKMRPVELDGSSLKAMSGMKLYCEPSAKSAHKMPEAVREGDRA